MSANVEDQQHSDQGYRSGYEYPMRRITASYVDERVARMVDGKIMKLDGTSYALLVSSTPQSRNSTPNPRVRLTAKATSR